jgi:hypothetical protein
MRNVTKVLVVLAAVFCLAAASPVFASSFVWSYSGGTDSGSGTFTATPNGHPGQYLITGITGTWDHSSITALLAPGTCCSSPANDNILYYPASPTFLDLSGVGFSFMAGGVDVNIYYCPGSCNFGAAGYSVLTSANPSQVSSANGHFTVAPEPMTLGLLGTGLVGLFLASKKRT